MDASPPVPAPAQRATTTATARTAKKVEPAFGLRPLLEGRQSAIALVALWVFVVGPFLALLAAVPIAWGWGLSWLDVTIAVTAYLLTGFGVVIGFHRYLTHGSFKATRPLRVASTVAGTLAMEGEATRWVADHRHAFSDRDGDPHSPWRCGTSVRKLGWAHDVRWPGQRRRPAA